MRAGCGRQVTLGFWLANVSLAVFFLALIAAGVGKFMYDGASFQEMMSSIRPFLLLFAASGVTLMIGLWIVLWHAFRLIGTVLGSAASPAVADDAGYRKMPGKMAGAMSGEMARP